MGDQWYYSYPPPNTQYNPQYPPPPNNPPYSHWPQSQYPPNAQYSYPVVPSYPPPPVPTAPTAVYTAPPTGAPPQNVGYNYNYPQQQYQYTQPPPLPVNDYAKDLENYKYIKSKISETESEKNLETPRSERLVIYL